MELARFDSKPYGFPKPRIPLLPARPTIDWQRTNTAFTRQSANFRHFSRGRYALGEAYRLTGVGVRGDLLVPAYHCVTMLDPALNLGANIRLYSLLPDLSPDLAGLDETVDIPGNPVKALLATHFFGFIQDFGPLKAWCEKRGIALIEDCSHALFTENFQVTGAGSFGHFVTSSPYKFFACEDGGLLYCRDESELTGIRSEAARLIDEIRGIKHSIEKYRTSTAQILEIPRLDEMLQALSLTPTTYARDVITSSQGASAQFSRSKSQASSLRSSRLIASMSSIDENTRARRKNYQRWLDAVAGFPNCRPLYSELPRSCTPYMFPLHIVFPEPHFYWLKQLGVPIWRWDEMAVSDCAIAQDYRLRLLHLPCHQSLRAEQIDWMIAAVEKTLRRPVQGVH